MLDQAVAVDLIKTLAWPAVVVWAAWYWRDELKAAAKRVTEIGLTGAKFAPPEPQIPTTPANVAATALGKLETIGDATAGPDLQAFIARITSFISNDQLQPSIQKIRAELIKVAGNSQSDQIEALIYNSASLNIQLSHERNYNAIFGSQLTLLAQANGAGGLIPALAQQIYEQTKSANPSLYATYTFESWISFLTRSGLVETNAAGSYVLTSFGRGFLKYIVDRQLTVFKPF